MAHSDPTVFEPKRLDRKHLQVPVTAGMRRMASGDRERWIQERTSWYRRYDWNGPRIRRRVGRYALAGAIGFPILNAFLHVFAGVGLGWNVLWIQIPVAALYGALVAVFQPSRMVCGMMFAAVADVVLVAAYPGSGGLGFLWALVMHALLYFCFGIAIGAAEDIRD